jgi:HEPN domain-containing protein
MNNLNYGQRLLSEAKECYEDMLNSYARNSWNMVVRRAQEVVELSLKALLKMVGVEYPKSHDVGTVFELACIQSGIEVDNVDMISIKQISFELAKDRAPAFYIEKIYSRDYAEKAKADAEFVLNFAEALSVKLKGNR